MNEELVATKLLDQLLDFQRRSCVHLTRNNPNGRPLSMASARRLKEEVENPQRKLVAKVDGLNLYASPIIDGEDREALLRTARYLLRPPFATGRFALRDDGLITYRRKRADRRGNTVLVLSLLELRARLASLIPIPRRQTHRLFGLLGANSKIRARIVPKATQLRMPCDDRKCPPASRQSIPWQPTFQIDAVKCPKCALTMRVVGVVKDTDEVKRPAGHLGADSDARIRGPPIAAA